MDSLLRHRLLYLAWLVLGFAALGAGWYAFGPAAEPSPRERYVEGVAGEPRLINPLYAPLNSPDADLTALLFNGLTRIDGDGTPRPDLAERWEVTADGLMYTFHLRPNIFWHDGERLDAHDIVFTVAQVQAPGFQGPPALTAQWSGVVVAAVDASTVTARLPAPSASFLTRAALGVLPEHLLIALGPAELYAAPFNRAPVGTGPYRLVELTAAAALLERNPSYHFTAPALREIELRFFRDRRSLAAALRDGQLDAALFGEVPTAEERAALDARPELAATEFVRGGYTVLYLNNQRDPLNDPRLRRALAASIDTPALLAGVEAAGLAGDGPIVPGSWAYAEGDWPPPEEAPALFEAAAWLPDGDGKLQRAGQPLGLELATNADPAREALAETVAAQLAARGVEVEVVTMPSVELLTKRLEPRDYDMVIFGWETEVDPDPYGGWHTSQILPPGRNVAGYNDPLGDALLEAARTNLDIAERRDLYERFTARFVETAPSVVLLYPARTYVHPAGLSGLAIGLLFEPSDRFRDVHLWRIDGGGE